LSCGIAIKPEKRKKRVLLLLNGFENKIIERKDPKIV
jgi:hypothetical protein